MQDGSVAIGTWPTPEAPRVKPMDKKDLMFLGELQQVFEKYGMKGSLTRVEFDCGRRKQGPERAGNRYRMCVLGDKGKPVFTWFCV